MIIMRDLDWQFGISNLAGDFNMNFFAWDWRICSKNWFFRKIEIRKIGDIFAINYSEKIPDHQSSSKNPVVSKNWRSNYRGSTVFANSGDPDQMQRSAASDLGLHSLPINLLGVSRLQWVNELQNVKTYSRTSLSRTRLFRITAYLEVKIWSLF